MPHDLGDTVPLGVTIAVAGAPVVPGSVTLTITGPDGVVPDTTPTNPSTGRYEFDFVPIAAGLYRVRWVSTAPASAFDDVVDVRPATTAAVVSLADAKQYLNMALGAHVDDDELRGMLAAAVRRVDRHLFTLAQRDTGSTLAAATQVSPEQRLAVLMVLAEFWRTQRARGSGASAVSSSASGAAMDSGPAGVAPLTVRLTELLGPAVPDDNQAAIEAAAPRGSFPAPCPWPDPVLPGRPW